MRNPQELEKENARLASENATLSSELALGTAVLEAVGVISKDIVAATERRKVRPSRHPSSPTLPASLPPQSVELFLVFTHAAQSYTQLFILPYYYTFCHMKI